MKCLIVDDEHFYLDFVTEYIEAKGADVKFASNFDNAISMLTRDSFALVLVDMAIPVLNEIPHDLRSRIPRSAEYPGLALILQARSLGYKKRSVVAFTVHDDDAIEQELRRLDVSYVLKGRPTDLKRAIDIALGRPRS